MKLSELKSILNKIETIGFILPDSTKVPGHFHVTEVGKISKHFIDCGGVLRKENTINLQLWEANDYDHRLHPEKLLQIIELSEKTLQLKDLDIEVEYQSNTIGRYGLDFNGYEFLLTNKTTNCLAPDKCGVPKEKIKLSELVNQTSKCTPGSGCC